MWSGMVDLYNYWVRCCQRFQAHLFGYANEKEINSIRQLLKDVLAETETKTLPDPADLRGEDQKLFKQIVEATNRHNRNNVTRTAAYLRVYNQNSELHWAFLAHMVSRNGGYNMTDLKGDLISRMMEPGEAERMFEFLERANYLIFGDAFPQLLLYQASLEKGQPLFHLLPYFRVSRFMQIVWERFWECKDSELLTLALVVNEQNFIEKRVAQHEKFKAVTQSFEFQAQTYLNLTYVVFPYRAKEKSTSTAPFLELAGYRVDTFLSLYERIDTGRHLYAILFQRPEVLQGALEWANATPHTGSRADYWPHLYTKYHKEQAAVPQAKRRYQPRIGKDGRLKKWAKPLYSPILEQAWRDVLHPEPAGGSDWCVRAEAAEELYLVKPIRKDVTSAYVDTLLLVEKAVAAETWVKK